jgi:hypothetical protein
VDYSLSDVAQVRVLEEATDNLRELLQPMERGQGLALQIRTAIDPAAADTVVVESSRGAVPVFRPARFPGPHPRTRRARRHAPGSPRNPSKTVALAFGSAVPSPTHMQVRDAGIHRRLLPCRPAAAVPLCPFALWPALPASPTTTGTPPRPAASSGRRACPGQGSDGSLPTFTVTRSARSVPSSTPAASPRVRRRLPRGLLADIKNRRRSRRPPRRRALQPGPHPSGWSRWKTYEASSAGSSRTPSGLACRTRTV